MIIQAIGRICRTNQKQKKVYVFAEHDIRNALDLDICNGRLLNSEFLSLIDAVKDMESKGVQCADRIMCPPIYNNIYKGALGEVLGKHIFERYVGLSVEKIADPAIFELFDYKIGNTKVFVDFKHWKLSYAVDADEYLQKIKDKAVACGAECIIVANLIMDEKHKKYSDIRSITSKDNSLKVLVVPALVLDRSDVVEVNSKAVMAVRKCVDGYSG